MQYFHNFQLSYVRINNKFSFNAVYYKTTIRIDNKASICTKDHMSNTTDHYSLILIRDCNFNAKSLFYIFDIQTSVCIL
jgi:hypothetical protein